MAEVRIGTAGEPQKTGSAAARTVYGISEVTEILRALVEDSLPSLWIQGEISNFSKPSSGHWYFTLKDEQAQIRCAMFRKANYYIRPLPQNGDAVLVRAKASVYPGRGELQLIVEHLEPAGTGSLLRAFEELKQRLAAEGLFDAARKRPITAIPKRIGLVTSATGAAVHDVLTTLARRWPLAQVLFYPVPVQGADAPAAIVKALHRFSEARDVDTLLLVRGGGSIEDLWAFNDEHVARAIRDCAIPIVTGVGHEIDITIADLAADLRAATPTAAAELTTPDQIEFSDRIESVLMTLTNQIEWQFEAIETQLQNYATRLQSKRPLRRMNERAQRLDELELRMSRVMDLRIQECRRQFVVSQQSLTRLSIDTRLGHLRQMLSGLSTRLKAARGHRHIRHQEKLAHQAAILASFNPNHVLSRGYAIVRDTNGTALRDAASTIRGEHLRVQLARGELRVQVEQTKLLR
jgi:exodeoxyribonuclease VII large subunit